MTEPFTQHRGIVAPMDRNNVDTDLIIPKQFLKSVERSGFGVHLFDSLRYMDEGKYGQDCSTRPLNMDFPLNAPRYRGASILLTRANFGCGSSREHAPWALLDYGFRCVIASSFADIFYNNCSKNGLLPVVLDAASIDKLFAELEGNEGYQLDVDLEAEQLTTPRGESMSFRIDPFRKRCLLRGLDEVGLTLDECAPDITRFEKRHREKYPWVFDTPVS